MRARVASSRRWSRGDFAIDLSAEVAERERFDYWQDVICDVFVKLDARRLVAAEEFTGKLSSVSAGSVRLSRMRVSAHEVTRTARAIARSDSHHQLINMPLDGRCDLLVQDGRSTSLGPGDFALSDTSRPYRLRFQGAFDMFVLHVPDELLAGVLPGLNELTATAVRADSPTGSLLRPLLERIYARAAGLESAAGSGAAGYGTASVPGVATAGLGTAAGSASGALGLAAASGAASPGPGPGPGPGLAPGSGSGGAGSGSGSESVAAALVSGSGTVSVGLGMESVSDSLSAWSGTASGSVCGWVSASGTASRSGTAGESEPVSRSGSVSGPESAGGSGSGTALRSRTATGSESVSGPWAGPAPGPGSASEAGSTPEAGSASGAGTALEAGSAPEAGSASGAGTALEAGSATGAGTAPGAATAPGAGSAGRGLASAAGVASGAMSGRLAPAPGWGSAPGSGVAGWGPAPGPGAALGPAALHLGAAVVDLVAASFAELREDLGPGVETARGVHLMRAKRFIDEQIRSPELTPSLVAAAGAISVRYLHALFQDEGTSVSRYILARRLELAARDLVDPRLADHTIAELARRNGFTNAAHFTRAFTKRYGQRPRDHRRS